MNLTRAITRQFFPAGLVMLGALLVAVLPTRAETLPPDVSAIIRQLDEWRMRAASWQSEVEREYSTNRGALVKFTEKYIDASSIANSLINQLQLETSARTSLKPKRYKPTLDRAEKATEECLTEGRRLMAAKYPATRGTVPYQTILDNAQKGLGVISNFMDVLSRHSKAFRDLSADQRKEVHKQLEERKWNLVSAKASPEKPADDSKSANRPAAPKS